MQACGVPVESRRDRVAAVRRRHHHRLWCDAQCDQGRPERGGYQPL